MTEEVISVPSTAVSVELLLKLRAFIEYDPWNSKEGWELRNQLDSILSHYPDTDWKQYET